MKRAEFCSLNSNEQARVVRERGSLLSRRKTDSLLVFLYQVDSFYVEVYFHLSHYGNVYQYRGQISFEDTDYLEPYLEEIALPELR